jgi:hypothetical protein
MHFNQEMFDDDEFFDSEDLDDFFDGEFFDSEDYDSEYDYFDSEDDYSPFEEDIMNIQVSEVKSTSFKVEWSKPFYCKQVKYYEVYLVQERKNKDKLIYKGKETFCEVKDLKPNTKHEFFIVGYNFDCYDEFRVKTCLEGEEKKESPKKKEKKKETFTREEFQHLKSFEVKPFVDNADLVWKKEEKSVKLKMNVVNVNTGHIVSFWVKQRSGFCRIKYLKENTKYEVFVQIEKEDGLTPFGFQEFETLKKKDLNNGPSKTGKESNNQKPKENVQEKSQEPNPTKSGQKSKKKKPKETTKNNQEKKQESKETNKKSGQESQKKKPKETIPVNNPEKKQKPKETNPTKNSQEKKQETKKKTEAKPTKNEPKNNSTQKKPIPVHKKSTDQEPKNQTKSEPKKNNSKNQETKKKGNNSKNEGQEKNQDPKQNDKNKPVKTESQPNKKETNSK